jgi:hypothetical protein
MTPASVFTLTAKCPVCGRGGCLVADENGTTAAVCRKVESPKRVGQLGFLHWVRDDGPVWSRDRTRIYQAAARLATEATR